MNQSEIAEILGVSQGAVSLVLNNPSTSRVSDSKKRQIIEYLKKDSSMNAAGYKKSWNIGYMIDPQQDIHQNFYQSSLSSIEEEAALSHYNVIVECFRCREPNLLKKGKIDGLIIRSGQAFEYLQDLAGKLPMVLLNCAVPVLCCDVVMPDNRGAMFKAVKYFAGSGRRKIGFLGGAPDYSKFSCNYTERFHGFSEACAYYGLAFIHEIVKLPVKPDHAVCEAVSAILEQWGKLKNPPDALISANHLYGAIAKELWPDVPIIAGDNKQEECYPGKQLITLNQNASCMGRMTVELLLRRIADPARKPVRVNCDVELMCNGKKVPD